MTAVPEKSPVSPAFLLAIYIVLMVLLALTIFAARLPLGALALLVALAIAAAKSILVILFFMHVRYSTRITWLFVGAGFLWLAILFSLIFGEYLGRTRLTRTQPLNAALRTEPPVQGPTARPAIY